MDINACQFNCKIELNNKCKYIVVWLSAYLGYALAGQQDYKILWEIIGKEKLCPALRDLPDAADTISIRALLQNKLVKCREEGWLDANLDSLVLKNDTLHISIFKGSEFVPSKISLDSTARVLADKMGYKPPKKVSWVEVAALEQKILSYLENNGYPFALVKRYPQDKQGKHTLFISVLPQHLIIMDTIQLVGNVKMNKKILYRHLGFKPGHLYSEKKLQDMAKRIKYLGCVSTDKAPAVLFLDRYAHPILYLKKNKTSRFDFLLGLLPGKEKGDKAQITGEAFIELQNAFGQAEKLKLVYRNYPGQEKRLELGAAYPYMPIIPAGVELQFQLLLQDTIFREVVFKPAFNYEILPGAKVKVFYQSRKTDLLQADTSRLALGILPAQMDMTRRYWGAGIDAQYLDDLLNARKGWYINAELSLGNKIIRHNTAIDNFINLHPERINPYDTLNMESLQIQTEGELGKYWMLGKNSTLLTYIKSGWLTGLSTSQDPVFYNEKFRLGGFRWQRGFDENSLAADAFLSSVCEYRYLLGKYSFLTLFADQSYLTNFAPLKPETSWNYGFGAGMNFETKAGLFSLYYALGADIKFYTADNEKTPQFRNGKIHFGYKNYF